MSHSAPQPRGIRGVISDLQQLRGAILLLVTAFVAGMIALGAFLEFRALPSTIEASEKAIEAMDSLHSARMDSMETRGRRMEGMIETNQRMNSFLICVRTRPEAVCVEHLM